MGLARNPDRAGRHADAAADEMEHRRLAGAVRPMMAWRSPALTFEIEAADDLRRTEILANVPEARAAVIFPPPRPRAQASPILGARRAQSRTPAAEQRQRRPHETGPSRLSPS